MTQISQPYDLGQNGRVVSVDPTAVVVPTAPAVVAAKEIPYDYAARFVLSGERGKRVQDVINVSVEGAFVATSIGHSFIPPDWRKQPFPQAWNLSRELADNMVGGVVNPSYLLQLLVIRLLGVEFKYSIIDSASGRELQNIPLHSLAGLGRGDGHRPFRPMAKPMLFLPRSTIRIEIEEISDGPLYKGAELFIVLHGYKILGYVATV